MTKWLAIGSMALLCMLNRTIIAYAEAPSFENVNGAIRIAGVGPDNPIIYDNDWWFDVFDKNYIWAQASLGKANLRGNIVSRDMWDCYRGYKYSIEECEADAAKALSIARESGLTNIPEVTRGADKALAIPSSRRVDDTNPDTSAGSRLIVEEAKKATPQKPLLVITGGPLTTVANALLTNPEIAPNMIVFGLTVTGGYNGNDAWAVFVVAQKTRYVDWGGGSFWDKDSVFRAEDFDVLPDNPLTNDMRRFIRTGLGQANQLGDGAPLVWLYRPNCWSQAQVRGIEFHGTSVQLTEQLASGTMLVIPKESTDLRASREEFLRVMNDPQLFR